jgi:tetratricopeptide (TPR) repeat protein
MVTLTVAGLLALPLSAQDWAGRGRAQGSVKDGAGNPIAGATVTLRPQGDESIGPDPITTNDKGQWSILGLAGGPWTVLVEKEGYKPAQGPYHVNPFQASPALEVVLAANPFSSVTVGDELLEAGDFTGARAEYEKAIPNLDAVGAARLQSRIGDTHMGEQNWAAARAAYALALRELEPAEQAHVRLQVANSWAAEGNNDQARAEWEALVPLLEPPGQAEVLISIARTYDLQDRRDDAIVTLERALELAPGNVPVLQTLADLLGRAGRDAEAQAYLDQLPDDVALPADMLLNMGIQKYNDGDLAGAMELFDRAVHDNASIADTYYYRGLVHLANGANAAAAADFQKLLELEPDSPHAAEAQDFLGYLAADG